MKKSTTGRLAAMAALIALSASASADDPAPVVRLETSAGDIDIELFPSESPRTVENFLRLVEENFYDGLIFHRVIANFMIQAGGYDGAMIYRKAPETVVNESSNGLSNSRGTVAMARTSDPDSADAQFFINVKDNGYLDARAGQPGYTVFGRVIAGMEAVAEVELSETHRRQGMSDVPVENIVIQAATRLR
ncbi:MAG: peptidylprolyl isomerase [Gammaproteobacteria bacterium]|nr:peptidylprolyl isomerase [Gammaproteobacteria bacterium]